MLATMLLDLRMSSLSCDCVLPPSSRLDIWKANYFFTHQNFYEHKSLDVGVETIGRKLAMRLWLVFSLCSAASLHELANKDCAVQRTVGCPQYCNCVSRYDER